MASSFTGFQTSKRFRLLTRKKDILGNEYVYLKGVASTAVGDAVVYDETGATARLSTSTATAQPVAVAMSANVLATTFGWYQIYGLATVASGALTVAADAYLQSTATTGAVDDTTTAGKTIVGATSASANSGGFITAWLNYPFYPNAALA
jgi:hypothetical protein